MERFERRLQQHKRELEAKEMEKAASESETKNSLRDLTAAS